MTMYVICTDGQEIVRSAIVTDEIKLRELDEHARQATGGNWWWEPGNKENAKLPKADEYRHLPTSAD